MRATSRPMPAARIDTASSSPRTRSGLRYSSIYFIVDELFQEGKLLLRRLLVDALNGIACVADDVVAHRDGLVDDVERDLALRAADIDDGEVVLVDGQDLAGKRYTHSWLPPVTLGYPLSLHIKS